MALFLFSIILSGATLEPLSAYAAIKSTQRDSHILANTPDTATEMKQNYPGPINGNAEQPPAVPGPLGESLQFADKDAQKNKPGEIVEKRTANSSFTRNEDGTITEKQYLQPIHFQKDGKWEKIDTTLIDDKDPNDTGFLGQVWGEVSSWFAPVNDHIVKDNKWQARFSASDRKDGMVRVREGGSQVGFVPVNANQVEPVITEKDGVQTVNYYNLWQGVDLSYRVTGSQVKEDIVFKDKNSLSQVSFKVVGAKLDKFGEGAFAIKGALNDEFYVSPINLMLSKYGPITDSSKFSQSYQSDNDTINIGVDGNYFKSLPDDAFPLVIDPGIDSSYGYPGTDLYRAIRSDNTVCNFQSNPQCKMYVGGLDGGSGSWPYWRTVFYGNYSRFSNPDYRLVVAKLFMNMQTGPGYHGTTANRDVGVWSSACNNAFNCVNTNLYGGYGTVGSGGEVVLTNLYLNRIAANDFGMWIIMQGEEGYGWESFKEFDPANTYLSFTWGDAPAAPGIVTPSSQGQVFTDPQVPFKLNTVANPNNNVPLQYEIQVSTASDGVGAVMSSGLLSSTQWTMPDNVLQDGTTYYVRARSYDSTGSGYGNWSASVSFKIDMRLGKDATQTYDSLGPVDINLATGNVATSAGSHTSAALGGSLGVGLNYNSPTKSRQGLTGQYWNNTTFNGSPVLTRTDANVDFNWDTSSPSAGINSDSFSTKWAGYFVAPTTGQYYFGAKHDDSLAIIVNSQTLYSGSSCTSSVCYGSAISLNAGQVVPIELQYVEQTGQALVNLWAKGAVTEQVVPSGWLQTPPRSIAQTKGLTGTYYLDDGTHNFNSSGITMFMQRNDTWLGYDWDLSAPVANGPADNFMVRWSGYFMPPVTGTYTFGAFSDDGARITVNSNMVLNVWQDQVRADRWGNNINLTAGVPVPIIVDYFEHTGGAVMALKVKNAVAEQVVPSDWLANKTQVLPDGWALGLDADGSLNYDLARINVGSVVLVDSSGNTHEYLYNAANGAYKPPINESGQLIRNADGSVTLQDGDGRTYVFANTGELTSVTMPTDDRNPAALKYEYSGTPAKLQYVRDGVDPSDRWARAYYSGESDCGSAPSGFDSSAPTNMLCALKTNDNRLTYFYYKNQRLARIALPGSQLTDYGYDSSGRLTSVRGSLANDAIAAGVRSDDATVLTEIAYDVLGRAISVKQPAATTGGSRLEHTVEYLPGNGTYYGATRRHVTGATEPNGFSQHVEYDALYRTTKVTDIAGLSTTQEWDATKDLVLSATDPTGLKTTNIYDPEDRLTDSYGPAPAGYYGSDRKPTATYVNQVPRNETKYDEGMTGLAVAWYNTRLATTWFGNSPTLYGAPKLHTTGILPSDPNIIGRDFVTNPAPITVDSGNDNIGFSATGKITLPQNGTYTLRFWHDDGARLYIDDVSKFADADWWHIGESQILSQGSFVAVAGKEYRFRLDYANRNAQYQIGAWLSGPGIADASGGLGYGTNYPGTYMKPNYNLVTSAKAYDSTLGNRTVSTNFGTNPELGLPGSSSVDPAGLNLTTTSTYETQGGTGSYLRQLTKTLPGGGTTNYEYYGATETKDDPCVAGTQAYKQAGFIKLKTEADPDGAGSQTGRKTETIYDDAGRVVASRYNTDSWTCTTYDTRSRIAQVSIPAYNGEAARTVQNDYAVGGDPLETTSWDGNGWIVVWHDLLGRTTKYRDVYDDETTTTYDTLGRVTQRSGPMGTEEFTYDNYHRLTAQKLDTVTYATPHYDAYSRVDYVDYPNAGQMRVTIGRDSLGRNASLTYRMGDGTTTIADTVTRTQSGLINGDTVSSGASSLAQTYSYDTAGRLTGATIGANTYTYGFGTQNSGTCGTGNNKNANSGKNSNRTSQTINGTTTYFCYDYADRLIDSSDSLYDNPTYDTHGNMSQIGTGSTPLALYYDSSDRASGYEQINSSGTGVGLYYDRDVAGRIIGRYKSTITNWTWASSGDYFYHYTGDGDSPDYLRDGNWNIIEKYIPLPGGITLTIKPQQSGNSQKQYSLSNIHGDTMLLANAAGTNTSTGNGPASAHIYDPFGQAVPGGMLPANTTASASFAYVGSAEKLTETAFNLIPISMGARVYLPTLGRFTQVDPIEGGAANNYVYALDPVNQSDLSGMAVYYACQLQCTASANYFQPARQLPSTTAMDARVNVGRHGAASVAPRPMITLPKSTNNTLVLTSQFKRDVPDGNVKGLSGVSGKIRFSWIGAVGGAMDYARLGGQVGGGVGCGVGALVTLPTGWGCLTGIPIGATIGSAGGAIKGFVDGGLGVGTDIFGGIPDSNLNEYYSIRKR